MEDASMRNEILGEGEWLTQTQLTWSIVASLNLLWCIRN